MNAAVKPSAIPAHPAIAAQIQAAIGGTPAPVPEAAELEAAPSEFAFEDPLDSSDYRAPVVAAEPPAPTEPPVEQPTDVPAEELTPSAPAAPAEPAAPPAAPQAAPDIEALFNQAVDHFEKVDYALDEATAKSLISEPDKVLPKLAARMHANILRAVIPQVMAGIPAMIERRIESRMQQARQEQGFFGRFPGLANPQFRTVVIDSLKIAKQMKPNGTPDEIEKEGAELAAYRLSKQQRLVASQQPAARGFQPSGTGGARPAPAQPDTNEFSQLSKERWWE